LESHLIQTAKMELVIKPRVQFDLILRVGTVKTDPGLPVFIVPYHRAYRSYNSVHSLQEQNELNFLSRLKVKWTFQCDAVATYVNCRTFTVRP
jgi:hypothetical protein